MNYISTEEQMELFPHLYEGYVPKVHGDWADWETPSIGETVVGRVGDVRDYEPTTVPVQPIEIDDDLGLELGPL